MAEEGKAKSAAELLKQIEEFEQTIKALQDNVIVLKKKIADNQAKYGPDITTWPKE